MAATPGGEDSVYDTGRLSLFDLILERTRAQNKKQLVHRLVCISKIRQDVSERMEIGGHYERLFKVLQTQVHGESVTGLLLIYPVHVIHVIETSFNVLLEVIRDLEEDENSISGMLLSTKILVCTGDLDNRLFNQWSFRTLNLPASRMQEFTTNEPIDAVVMEALALLIKLGEYLAKLPKLPQTTFLDPDTVGKKLTNWISLTKAMDQLPEKVPDLLVRQDLIEYLLNSQDLSTPSAYLKRYTQPLDIVLDSAENILDESVRLMQTEETIICGARSGARLSMKL